jgi:hypothetical protein
MNTDSSDATLVVSIPWHRSRSAQETSLARVRYTDCSDATLAFKYPV